MHQLHNCLTFKFNIASPREKERTTVFTRCERRRPLVFTRCERRGGHGHQLLSTSSSSNARIFSLVSKLVSYKMKQTVAAKRHKYSPVVCPPILTLLMVLEVPPALRQWLKIAIQEVAYVTIQ
jgi:hypothetical protein